MNNRLIEEKQPNDTYFDVKQSDIGTTTKQICSCTEI